ncbi:hypothetical protein C0J52_16872 [Blattella germanica]|nr:hypothetical protein C0J52_16872 [Blattella germanica]
MDNTTPIPKPRSNCISKKHSTSNVSASSVKKPIPLPRMKKSVTNCGSVVNPSDSSNHEIKPPCVVSTSNANMIRPPIKRMTSKQLKEEWKLCSEEAQVKGKCLIENTKQVSSRLEKSVRNMIARRLTVRSSPERDDNNSAIKVNRSLSLPSESIFQSISFDSPLNIEDASKKTHIIYEDSVDSEYKLSGAPPPVYPPPPLPDESVYDEVVSVVSSHSSSICDTYSEAYTTDTEQGLDKIYEEIALGRNNLIHTSQRSNSESDCPYYNGDPSVSSLASSWNYLSKDAYQNVSVAHSSDSDGNDSSMCKLDVTADFVKNPKSKDIALNEKLMETDTLSQLKNVSSISMTNDLYENWEVPSPSSSLPKQTDLGRKVLTKSVILEFDPLFGNSDEPDEVQDFLNEFILQNDNSSPYGKINKRSLAKNDILVEHEIYENTTAEILPLPVPPTRFDSLTLNSKSEDIAASESESVQEPAQNLDLTSNSNNTSVSEPTPNIDSTNSNNTERNRKSNLVRWSSMKKAIQSMTDRRVGKDQIGAQNSVFYGDKSENSSLVRRPKWNIQSVVNHSGALYRCDRLRNFVQRHCVLAEGKLTCFTDKSGSCVGDSIPLEKVLSIQRLPERKVGANGEDLFLFEINLSWKGSFYLFGVPGSSERRVWMQKILESLTSKFPARTLTDYTRAGWSYIKEGISGTWTSGWILVHKRSLVYTVQDSSVKESDLRKARCTVLQDSKHETATMCVVEKGPLILVDFPGQSLYLQMDTIKDTMAWHNVIRSAAVDNGLRLDQQQLTRDDIPTIVDKCINFVYAHGSLSEGIYRRNGANSSVTKLLTLFRQDAWSVQLTRQEYTEYDISSVLKRFLRDLPEPLLTAEIHSQLCEIAAGVSGPDRVRHYKSALERLPHINYVTTRKLIGHLHFIHQQHEKNLMPVENLAAIWGPTLLHVEGVANLNWSKLESGVVSDLILLYSQIFEVDAAELQREKLMQQVLERYHAANTDVPQTKSSGDLKIWIYLENRSSSNCVNVTIGPQKLAREVCSELCSKMSLPAHELCLEEVVCGGSLTRPLHHTERVLDVVLRWGYWDDADRKDNCLVLCKNSILKEAAENVRNYAIIQIIPNFLLTAKFPMALCGDLRFADCKSRSFKTYLFEFSQAKLCYYKDKREKIIFIRVWSLSRGNNNSVSSFDIVLMWAITFIDKQNKPKRSKENPYFGYTIAGTSKEEQLRWVGAMLASEHPQHLLPSPELLQ